MHGDDARASAALDRDAAAAARDELVDSARRARTVISPCSDDVDRALAKVRADVDATRHQATPRARTMRRRAVRVAAAARRARNGAPHGSSTLRAATAARNAAHLRPSVASRTRRAGAACFKTWHDLMRRMCGVLWRALLLGQGTGTGARSRVFGRFFWSTRVGVSRSECETPPQIEVALRDAERPGGCARLLALSGEPPRCSGGCGPTENRDMAKTTRVVFFPQTARTAQETKKNRRLNETFYVGSRGFRSGFARSRLFKPDSKWFFLFFREVHRPGGSEMATVGICG